MSFTSKKEYVGKPFKVPFFAPGQWFTAHKYEVMEEIERVLSKGDLILRDDVEFFERVLAEYVGTKYAIGVNSGTDALSLCLQYFGIGTKDTVLVPSYTFRATPDTALRTGAKVKLYDLNDIPNFAGISVWMPAYIAGFVPDWVESKIKEARERGIIVIEDTCQAIGAAPVRGHAACYSFYPAKILGAYGDAGGIATDDRELSGWLKRARNHFKGEEGPVGLNSRLDNIQAAVLNVKLKYLPEAIKRRKEVALMYDEGLVYVTDKDVREVYQDYIIYHPDVDGLYEYLKLNGIETMRNGYPFAGVLKKLPQTVEFEKNSLRLPCNENLTNTDVKFVIEKINAYGA